MSREISATKGSCTSGPDWNDDAERTRELGARVWAEMQQRAIVPTPRAFELWFTFRSGVAPDLTRQMTQLLASGQALTPALLDGVHHEFLAMPVTNTDMVSDGAAQIQQAAEALATQVATGNAAVTHYADTLTHWAERIGDQRTVAGLVGAVTALTDATMKAAERNRKLEQQLSASATRIGKLRQSLSDVKQEASTDTLTGIANRKAFQVGLKQAIFQARAVPSSPLSVMMLDVDHFKIFNDTYGHATGDLVLRLVARLLTDNSKGRDTVARYGGEEFAILLVGADLESAITVANQICESLSSKRLVMKGSKQDIGQVTISIGVAEHRAGDTMATLIDRADAALYRAKELGRNQVCSEAQLMREVAG